MTLPLEHALAGDIEALQAALRGALGPADVLGDATTLQAAARALHRQLR